MAEYKNTFRPLYNVSTKISSKQSLVDRINGSINRISDSFYNSFKDKSWKEIKDDYVTTTINDVNLVKKDVVDHLPTYAAMSLGMGFSILGNHLGAQDAAEQGYNHTFIEWISYGWELGFHVGVSAVTYATLSRMRGESWTKITKDLVELSIVTTPIQLGPYALGRNALADNYMNIGMLPDEATVSAQLWLLVPYVATAKYTAKSLVPRVEAYFKKKNYFSNGKNKNAKSGNNAMDVIKPKDVRPGSLDSAVRTAEKAF